MWLVKLYEVCPKSISYLGDEEWVGSQREAKRFETRAEAAQLAEDHDATLVRLKPKSKVGALTVRAI
jgi:hypothetical protein